MEALVVQKYGGTSLANPSKIKAIAKRIADRKTSGHSVLVVVSAMADTTDSLTRLAHEITDVPPDREMDMLLTAGERISMALLSMALKELGVEAISFTGSQAGIITDNQHRQAEILEVKPIRVEEELNAGKVVIVAGFQGVSKKKEVTTLGRGGSDTTAVALAAYLKAERCEVYTDVPGILSADPKLVKEAKTYEELPLSLALELAKCGAEVMHPRSLEYAIENNFNVFVGHSETGKGTKLYTGSIQNDTPNWIGLARSKNQISVIGPKINDNNKLKEILEETLRSNQIAFDGLTCFSQSIRVSLSTIDTERAVQCLHQAFSDH